MSMLGYQRHDMERISKTLYGESDEEEKKKKWESYQIDQMMTCHIKDFKRDNYRILILVVIKIHI